MVIDLIAMEKPFSCTSPFVIYVFMHACCMRASDHYLDIFSLPLYYVDLVAAAPPPQERNSLSS